MPNYNVSTGFTGVDKLTPKFKKFGKSAAAAARKMSGAFAKVNKAGASMKNIAGGVLLAGGIQRGIGLLAQGIRTVSTEFVAFDDAITAASAKFKDLTPETLVALKKEARAVGATTKFSAAEAAGGLDFLAMAGFNAQQSIAVLAPTAELAVVANVDLARSTDIASDSLGAFGLMTEDSTQLQSNFIRMNDSMAKTMTSTNTGIEDMFEAIKKGAPAFTAAGQRMNSFNSFVGILAGSGVKGSEAGTAIRNIMLRLAKPTGEAGDLIKQLGVKTQDSSGNFRDVVDIVADLETGLKGMGSAQRTAALSTIFGARTVTSMNILLKSGSESIRNFRTELDNSGGSAKKMAGIMQQSLGNRLLSLRSALIEVGFKFFEAFETQGSNALDTITNAVRNFNVEPIINGLKFVFQVIQDLWPMIKIVVPLWTAWTVAQWALNVAMTANPIGLILAGIAALIVAGKMLMRNWDPIKNFFVGLMPIFRQIGLFIFNFLISPIKALLLIMSKIPGVSGLAKTGLEQINGIEQKILGEIKDSPDTPVEAPNAAKESGRRALAGEGTITVKAEKGTEVTNVENGIQGVDLAMAGAN
jgi:TP901 family phage tail tape measure protein